VGLVLLAGLARSATAQAPPVPGGAAAAAPTATTAAAATGATTAPPAAPAGGGNLWSFFCLTPAQKQACKDHLCALPLVQLLGNAMTPLSTMTGGVLGGSCCPGPNTATAAELAAPPDSAEGAAGRVKADEADAPKRRAAVRYMSTADCHRWPEVQDALINSLRFDRNECVRWEAALAFTRGCCCTKPVIRALTLTVSGSEDDGAPAETSERVKAAAHAALDHCLACYVEIEPVPPPPPPSEKPKEGPKEKKGEDLPPPNPGASKGFTGGTQARITPAEYYRRVNLLTMEQVVAEAKRVREHMPPISGTVSVPRGERSFVGLVQTAMASKPTGPSTSPPPESAPASTIAPASTSTQASMTAPTSSPAPVSVKKSSGGLFALFGSKNSTPAPTTPANAPQTEVIVSATAPKIKTVPAPTPPAPVPSTTVPALTQIPSVPPANPPTPAVHSTWAPYSPTTTPVGVTQTSFVQPAPSPAPKPATVPVATTTAPAPVPAVPPPSILPQPEKLLIILRDAARPEHRTWAADVLGSFDGWTNPKVVDGLVKAAREDKSPAVRAVCARNLGRMNVRSMAVLSAVQTLKSDPDANVRAEAEKALRVLSNEPVATLGGRR
jgi:hypothetical protein